LYSLPKLIAGPGHDQPEKQVGKDTGHAAGDQGDQEGQPEPEGTDAEEFGQPTAHPRNDAVMPGAPEGIVLGSYEIISIKKMIYLYIR
jgi:hypothetical protein